MTVPAVLEQGGARHRHDAALVAVPAAAVPAGVQPVWILDEPPIAVVPAEAGMRGDPVYRQDADGALVVPTGRLFVRFAEGVDAAGRRAALDGAGYAIDEVPPWAPHTAWVRATRGGVAAALAHAGAVRALPDVQSVEAELLRPRATRG